MHARPVTSVFVILALAALSMLHAGPIPPAVFLPDLKSEISTRNDQRDSSIREVRFLLESDQAQSLSHLVSLEKVTTALPTLNDATLTDLADRSREANDQIRAGAILPIIFWGAYRSVHEQNEAHVDDEERRGAQSGNRWQEARWTGAHPEAREPDE